MSKIALVWWGFCIGRAVYSDELLSSIALLVAGTVILVGVEIYDERRSRDRHTSNP